MKKIVQGYQKFFDQYFKKPSVYQQLLHKQKPDAMFISCCDSRVDPALLVSAQPGDIFVERNVANVVPAKSDGPNSILIALEVALCSFEVANIVVLGHQHCLGVQMLATNTLHKFGDVPLEYTHREKDLQQVFAHPYDATTASDFEKLNVVLSCQNLLTHSIVADRVGSKKTAIHGWYLSLQTGEIQTLCMQCFKFTDLMTPCCDQVSE